MICSYENARVFVRRRERSAETTSRVLRKTAVPLPLAELKQEVIEGRSVERHDVDLNQGIIVQSHGGASISMIHHLRIAGEAKIEQGRPDAA